MKTEMLLAAALVIGFAFVPAVAADDGVEGDCDVPAEATLVDVAGLYVSEDGGVFEESNDEAGLQSEAGQCLNEEDELIHSWDADTPLL